MDVFKVGEVVIETVPIVAKLKAGQITDVEAVAEAFELADAKGLTLKDAAALIRKFGPEILALLPKKA